MRDKLAKDDLARTVLPSSREPASAPIAVLTVFLSFPFGSWAPDFETAKVLWFRALRWRVAGCLGILEKLRERSMNCTQFRYRRQLAPKGLMREQPAEVVADD